MRCFNCKDLYQQRRRQQPRFRWRIWIGRIGKWWIGEWGRFWRRQRTDQRKHDGMQRCGIRI